MNDFDLFVRFKDITGAKTSKEMAKMLGITHNYISNIKSGKVNLSEKTAHKMWLIGGEQISQMWGKLQIEKLKKNREKE